MCIDLLFLQSHKRKARKMDTALLENDTSFMEDATAFILSERRNLTSLFVFYLCTSPISAFPTLWSSVHLLPTLAVAQPAHLHLICILLSCAKVTGQEMWSVSGFLWGIEIPVMLVSRVESKSKTAQRKWIWSLKISHRQLVI